MALIPLDDDAGSSESRYHMKDVDFDDFGSVPKVGMEFCDDVQAYEFYNTYAHRQGFSVRIRSWDKNVMGEVTRKAFVCHREGFTLKKGGSVRVRTDARCGCLARMVVKRGSNGRLYISQFEPTHNHQVVTSNKVNMLWSHRRKLHPALEELPDNLDMSVTHSCDYIEKQNGESKNSGHMPLEYKNYLRGRRTVTPNNGDVGALMQYLQDKNANDPSFFSAIQLDNDELITNIFWADARSRLDFRCFGDVVCFDTTLKLNKSGRPFAFFIGVNHHRQNVIFGTAFLYDHSSESFEWLFRAFVGAMKGLQPKVVLTDQDPAITNALLKVWPDTFHQLCVHHIFQNCIKYFGYQFNSGSGLRNDFSNCVFHCDDHDSFIFSWQNMLNKHNLVDNEYLSSLFKEKEKFVLAYGQDNFCAGMNTNEMDQSINNILKRYLNSKLDILSFLEYYDELVDDQRHDEFREDTKATETAPAMLYTHLLREAAKVYTPNVFEMVRKEAMGVLDCDVDCMNEHEHEVKFKVTSMQSVKEHLVSFESSSLTVSCSCRKFESIGILCSHALKVLDHVKVKQIPKRYILRRWTKNAKSDVEVHSIGDDKSLLANNHGNVYNIITMVARKASKSQEACKYVESQAMLIMEEVDNILKKDTQ